MTMIDHNTALEFETDDDGCMVDHNKITIDCDHNSCEAPATHRVVVSVNEPHDGVRNYCDDCYNIYLVGVQHGRHHEAACHKIKPGRGSSQEPPQIKKGY